MKQGGESLKLPSFNSVWKRLRDEKGVIPYSFRHAYAKRGHLEYRFHERELAPMMGHSIQSHKQYSRWYSEELLEDSFERAVKRREKNSHIPKRK